MIRQCVSFPYILFDCSEASAKIDTASNRLNAEITELLNSLLEGYNKHLRPGFGGKSSSWGIPPAAVLPRGNFHNHQVFFYETIRLKFEGYMAIRDV